MATYYPSSSNQRDAMPEISTGDSLRAYPEGQVLSNNMMMYLNQSPSEASYSDSVPGNYQLQLNCGELPPTGGSLSTPSSQGNLSDLISSHIREPPYDGWRDGRIEMSFMQPMSGSTTMQSVGRQIDSKGDLVHSSVNEGRQLGLLTPMETLQRGPNLQGQGLSLSLSTQIPTAVPVSLFQYRNPNLGLSSFFSSYPSASGDGSNTAGSCRDDEIGQSGKLANVGYFAPGFPKEHHNVIKEETGLQYIHSNRLSGLSNIIPNSKYLKVARQLLDEIVDVQKALQQECNKQKSFRFGLKVSKDNDGEPNEECGLHPTNRILRSSEESNTNPPGELSPADSQDLQNKVTELLSMLDEVDKKYRQYYHQMQIVASYFDGIAGIGASKPYTTLALQTISRHFRGIRDAIGGQIKAIRSSLGEEDTAGNTKNGGISRLRFVEQKLRQHRALQQLGMMQQHAWRPQRGLPETSVTVLRAWLFEHFLNPYPKDSDKIMLARQTGLTRGQVSNWFINARVRLWKPMIEDMYKEEIGDSELDSNSSSDNTPKSASHGIKVSGDMGEASHQLSQDVEMSAHASGQIETSYCGLKLMVEQSSDQDALFQADGNNDIADSAAYQMAELEMFGSQGGISLTLGLQHFDGPMSDENRQNFVPMQGDDMFNGVTSSVEPNDADTDCMDPDNQQFRFGTSHLLHDFVEQ